MEPLSALTPNSDGDEDKKCLMALSVTELISILRSAYRTVDFDRVEEVLVDKETKLKSEIGMLSEKLEMERLERIIVEEQVKKYKEQFEKGKKAEERYEKLLKAVKKNSDLGDGNTVTELRNKNRKLEDEKRRAESETESWKRKCEELNERLLTVEKGARSSMNGYVEIRANAEDISGARRCTGQGVSTEALDEMELNEVVKRAVDSGNTPVDSSPSQRKTKFVNLASDDRKKARLETEDVHDDRSTQQRYNTRSQRRGSYNEMQNSSGKSFWCNMPEGQEVAKINKTNRGKQTIHNTSGLKNQASKKGKLDAQHQRQINGNEIASPTVQTKIGTIVEKQSQGVSSNEMVIDGRGDASKQALVIDGRGGASKQALVIDGRGGASKQALVIDGEVVLQNKPWLLMGEVVLQNKPWLLMGEVMLQHKPWEPQNRLNRTCLLGRLTGYLTGRLTGYLTGRLTGQMEKVTSLGQQLEKLKALNSMFTHVIRNQSEL